MNKGGGWTLIHHLLGRTLGMLKDEQRRGDDDRFGSLDCYYPAIIISDCFQLIVLVHRSRVVSGTKKNLGHQCPTNPHSLN